MTDDQLVTDVDAPEPDPTDEGDAESPKNDPVPEDVAENDPEVEGDAHE